MSDTPLKEVIESTIDSLKNIMSADTVVGQPINAREDTVIIPVSKVSVGFTSGGVDFDGKKTGNQHFGGGNGAGMSVTPVAFLVVSDRGVEILNIDGNDEISNLISGFITKTPEMIEKIKSAFSKKKTDKVEVTEE